MKIDTCVIYWCDKGGLVSTYRFRSGICQVVGLGVDYPTDCLWLFPTWEAFEEASK